MLSLDNRDGYVCDVGTENPKDYTESKGLPIRTWKDWIAKREMSVGQFYNMIHGRLGAGLLDRRESKWHLSDGFSRELEEMLTLYRSETRS